ncbi:16505_t:CDS:2 [Cetraspora pellucida]|uniref:16505_t:CDS:1 n=1 Tax=Cetraspora pellucida TaxID=1433469 RepID=A0A9N8YYT1_9GLOM|nr:16505_t:CDS:2 [Cetraspora pellucida]
MNDTDWNKFKVPELKAKCKELGLHVSGTKKALIDRILSYYHVDPNQEKNVEKALQIPDKRKAGDNIETSQRKSKRLDDGSRRGITSNDRLTFLDSNISESQKLDDKAKLVTNDLPEIRPSVYSTEEAQKNLIAIPVTVETSSAQNDASGFSKSYPKKTLVNTKFNTKINTRIPLQNAFNTDSNPNLSNVASKVSRPHSINTNTNKNTLSNLSHRSSAFKETGKPKRQKIHHVIHKQNNIKNCIAKPNNTGLSLNQTKPILFPLIQIPQEISHHEIHRIEILTSCLEQTDFQTVLAAEYVCRLWKYAALLAWRGLCKRNFNGILLNNALRQYSNPYNSFKNYYKRRLEIRRYNITLISRSWIGQLYENLGHSPTVTINNNVFMYGIHQKLYSSNDHTYQLFVTLRVWVARFYCYTQYGGYTGLLENMPCILDTDEIIDEIWKIRLVNGDELMVLCATGEVIGHCFDNIHDNDNTQEPSRIGWLTLKNWIAAELRYGKVKEQLRVDWATYICSKSQFTPDNNKEHHILPSTIDNSPVFLISKVITENENYPNSIHKSITFENNPLEYIYSARYVLSSVEPFTVSGTLQPKPHWKVARILAFKHSLLECVESIRLPGEKVFGKTLSENVCFVQTPSRGVFVLRVTGQIIGNEDDGINFMWQMILGCGYYGEIITNTEDNMKSFQITRLEYFKGLNRSLQRPDRSL